MASTLNSPFNMFNLQTSRNRSKLKLLIGSNLSGLKGGEESDGEACLGWGLGCVCVLVAG